MHSWRHAEEWLGGVAQQSVCVKTTRRTSLASLPSDLLLEVAHYLSDKGEILQFALTCSHIFHGVLPSVYSTVELCGQQQCENTLFMLCSTPSLARHVQQLIVYPDHLSPGLPCEYAAGQGMCSSASLLVSQAVLAMDALHTFAWNATWGEPIDTMWTNLRRSCPNLKHVRTTFTERLPSPRSPLFTFRDLHSFSLCVKPIFYVQGHDLSSRECSPIYKRLWDMLSLQCPDLRSLGLESDINVPLFADRLLRGCWPSLRTLRLGPIRCDADGEETAQDLVPFLERHPSIEHLSLREVAVDLSRLAVDALPKLERFSGSVEHLRVLAARGQQQQQLGNAMVAHHSSNPVSSSLADTLRGLAVLEPMPLRELTPLAISSILVGLNSLTSLTVVFSLETGYDSNGVFRTIVSACPQLIHLDLTCTSKPSFYLEAFSRTLRGLTKLRTMSLTIVKVPGDETMQSGATRIALSNPRLARFRIAYIPAYRLQAGRAFRRPEALHEGRFMIHCDTHSLPITLYAFETWRRFGGLGKRVFRRSVVELRPCGHPEAARKSWPELLMERSPAGEETRLFMLSASLLLLAAWGIAKSLMSTTA